MLQRKIIVDVTPTPVEIAFEFSVMDTEQQAIFFNELARLTSKWDKPFCFQLQMLIDEPALTQEGRLLMQNIGDYGSTS